METKKMEPRAADFQIICEEEITDSQILGSLLDYWIDELRKEIKQSTAGYILKKGKHLEIGFCQVDFIR